MGVQILDHDLPLMVEQLNILSDTADAALLHPNPDLGGTHDTAPLMLGQSIRYRFLYQINLPL
jgi:hypothetical protein